MERFLLNDVDISRKLSAFADRHVERRDFLAIDSGQIFNRLTVGNTVNIHICYKKHSRKMILLAQFPGFLRTCLYTGFSGNDDDGPVGNTQCLFHFAYEIKITGCVQNIDLVIIPFNRNQRSSDRNLSLLLFLCEVTDCSSVFDFPHSRSQTAQISHSLCQSCLACAAVSEDYDVSDFVSCVNFHTLQPPIQLLIFPCFFISGRQNLMYILTNCRSIYKLYLCKRNKRGSIPAASPIIDARKHIILRQY